MSLARDLLDQAALLARREPRRPKQASLRRAISTAYYALFHLLIDASSRFLVAGNSAARRTLREQLARSYDHGAMSKASKSFTKSTGPWTADGALPPKGLVRVAEAFISLQEERHAADYNVRRTFTRTEALAAVAQAAEAFRAWETVKGTEDADAYLVALLAKTRQ